MNPIQSTPPRCGRALRGRRALRCRRALRGRRALRESIFGAFLLVASLAPPSSAQHASTRLSDELRNLPGMHSTTLDRFHTHLAGQGLGGAFGLSGAISGPAVVVLDGMPIGEPFLGAMQWNALPVATVALDTLYARGGWMYYGDRVPSDGSIIARTRYPEGWSTWTSVMPVNETGDPGPDMFRNSAARNVDRSGPAVESVVAFRQSESFVEAGYRFDEHHMTDPLYSDRVWRSYNELDQPRARIHAPWMRARVAAANMNVHALATWTRIRDFRYVAAFGREWPTREEALSLTIQAETAGKGPWSSGLRVAAHDRTIHSRTLRIAAPGAIAVRTGRVATWVGRCVAGTASDWCLRLDGGAFVQEIQQASVFAPRTVTASVGLSLDNPRAGVSVWFWSEVHGRRPSPAPSSPHSGAATAFVRPIWTRHHQLELRFESQSRRPPVGTSFLELYRMGISFADFIPEADDTGVLADPGYFTRERISDVIISWNWAPDPDGVWRLQTEAGIRQSSGLTLPILARTRLQRPSPVFRETHVHTGVAGRMATASVRVDRSTDTDNRAVLAYRFTRRIADGNLPFWMAMEGLPPHKLDVDVTRRIVQRLHMRLFASVRSPHDLLQHRTLQSPTAWMRPWTVRTEASITKHVFQDRGSLTLGVMNIPDAPLLEHPEGGNEQLAARVLVDIRL